MGAGECAGRRRSRPRTGKCAARAAHRGWGKGATEVLWRKVLRKRAGVSREEMGAKEHAGQARTLQLNVIACHSMCGRWATTLGAQCAAGRAYDPGRHARGPPHRSLSLPSSTVPPKAQPGPISTRRQVRSAGCEDYYLQINPSSTWIRNRLFAPPPA